MTDFKLTFDGFQIDGISVDPWKVERYVNELLKSNEELEKENEQLKKENELLKQDLEHCANQFKEDGKNVLLGLR